ncbi:hypothetical protein UPYG_G00291550 [Umbra pygmaea]|uniref:USP domain-containing protein n=1 Tax=Umbra pygmaea TaxID=75934 RepID=A0ABD0W5C9_UMBPY
MISIQVPGGQTEGEKWHLSPAKPLTSHKLTCLGLPRLYKGKNTCYMNATLQCLLAIKPFFQDIFKGQTFWILCDSGLLFRTFSSINDVKLTKNKQLKKKQLEDLKHIIAHADSGYMFRGRGQQFACTFLKVVLYQMREKAQVLQAVAASMGGTYTCPVENNFLFKMARTRTCHSCGRQSITKTEFIQLSVAVEPGLSVEDIILRNLKENELGISCHCGGQTSGQRWTFQTLPRVLVIHLKRLKYLTHTDNYEKNDDAVHLSRELLFSCYQTIDRRGSLPNASVIRSSSRQEASREERNSMGLCKYKLVSVLSHLRINPTQGYLQRFIHGALPPGTRGRYVADAAYESWDHTDRWLSYEDKKVKETTGAAVCDQRTKTSNVLFYEKQVTSLEPSTSEPVAPPSVTEEGVEPPTPYLKSPTWYNNSTCNGSVRQVCNHTVVENVDVFRNLSPP